MKKNPTRNRARIEIINYILQFSTTRYFGHEKEGYHNILTNIETAFRCGSFSIGSLVILSSAPFTKWYLSWLKEYKDNEFGGSWLLESIEDGSLCWWTNVNLYYYPKALTDRNPHWKWNDNQWVFWDKWKRACKRRGRIVLPVMPKFTDDGGVILATRTMFSSEDENITKSFPDWRKVRVTDMLDFYDYSVSVRQNPYK